MTLHINNREANSLVEAVMAMTGESETEAVITAMRHRLHSLQSNHNNDDVMRQEIADLIQQFNRYPVIDHRSDEEILGYNAFGASEY